MPDIKCTVSTCKFFKDLVCKADAIEVNCDSDNYRTQNKEETHCETFRKRS